jgi:EAL domain-containing protein (putative c-di-GMP-specific phosphodiesterase class I)
VRLSIDDFGTGYSSLAYLKRFPVTSLKIDRSFVDGLGTDPEDTAIVAAVVELAHALGLLAVAEGVETVAQLDRLRALGCDYGQGWYFGRAVDAAELGANPVVELRSWQIDGRWVADSPEALSIEKAQ